VRAFSLFSRVSGVFYDQSHSLNLATTINHHLFTFIRCQPVSTFKFTFIDNFCTSLLLKIHYFYTLYLPLFDPLHYIMLQCIRYIINNFACNFMLNERKLLTSDSKILASNGVSLRGMRWHLIEEKILHGYCTPPVPFNSLNPCTSTKLVVI